MQSALWPARRKQCACKASDGISAAEVVSVASKLRYAIRAFTVTTCSRRTDMAALQPGAQAPEFSLATHTGQTLALSSFRGRPTIVSFLPFAFTGG